MKRNHSDKAIGQRLKTLRESRGIKQNFVAEKLGISGNFLSELESGKRRWPATIMEAYEEILGV